MELLELVLEADGEITDVTLIGLLKGESTMALEVKTETLVSGEEKTFEDGEIMDEALANEVLTIEVLIFENGERTDEVLTIEVLTLGDCESNGEEKTEEELTFEELAKGEFTLESEEAKPIVELSFKVDDWIGAELIFDGNKAEEEASREESEIVELILGGGTGGDTSLFKVD